MLYRLRCRRKNPNSGFSLVELLVVVAILAILAAIAIPLFLNQKQKARMTVLKSDLRNAMTGVETARNNDGTFGNGATLITPIVDTIGKTSPLTVIVAFPNCAQNVAGTAVERSPGNYALQGYVQSAPGVFVAASGTTTLTYDSKSKKWEEGGSLYSQLQAGTSPCETVNGGSGHSPFYWNSSNTFEYYSM